jgi:hypothetical protein
MRRVPTTLQRPLSRRLLPLAYALVAVVGTILVLTWFALQIQVTLAGFLNSESVWSKAQKQAVIALDAYADSGSPEDLANFRSNYAILDSDRQARDAIASGHFDQKVVDQAFVRGNVIPSAKPGMIFMLQHFSGAPHLYQALQAWRSTDPSIAELASTAAELQRAHAAGVLPHDRISRFGERIHALNDLIEPQANRFSLEIAHGTAWMGKVLFGGVLGASCIAALLWLGMARRILASVRGTEERYRLLFDSAADCDRDGR